MFWIGVMLHVCSAYIAMRTLFQLEPLTSAPTLCVLMLDRQRVAHSGPFARCGV